MYKYEMHLHTYPASDCGKFSPERNVKYYASLGYDGIFITNHFLDGNTGIDRSLPFEGQIDAYFKDYEEAVEAGKKYGIKVFLGLEMSYNGTDFLVYLLDKQWFKAHPEILKMNRKDELDFLRSEGAFITQAHPFHGAERIDHIRLFPKSVDAVEVFNASRPEFENTMSAFYANHYGLINMAGSDNHWADKNDCLAGMMCETPAENEKDFFEKVRRGEMKIFTPETK